MSDGEDIEEHIQRMRGWFQQINNIAPDSCTEADWITTLVASLPDSWDTFTQSVSFEFDTDDKNKLANQVSDLRSRIMAEAHRRSTRQPDGKAFFSTNKPNFNNRFVRTNMGSKGPDKSKSKCNNCGKIGHWAAECRGPGGGAYKPGQPNKSNNGGSQHQRFNPPGKFRNGNARVHIAISEAPSRGDYAFSTLEDNYDSIGRVSNVWIADSGTTTHIAKDRKLFSDYRKASGYVAGVTGKEPILGRGTVELLCQIDRSPNEYRSVKLTNGNRVLMDRDRLEIVGANNETIIVGSKLNDREQGNLWKINTKTMSAHTAESEMHIPTELVLTKQTGRTWFEWHKVLGHIGPQALQRLKSTNAVVGMEVAEDNIGLNFECEACIQSKAHIRAFPKESQSKVSEIGRFRYYVSFTDVATRFTRLGFLKHKDETLNEYKAFEAMLNTQLNKKIKRVCFDNGREFVNKDWIEHTNQKGTILETTAPYSAQQNGIAERLNRTLTEKVRAMLIESAAPKFLWSEAIAYACYLKNCVPTQVHRTFWKTPFEAFWGKIPDGENRSKLDSKTTTALFTGISDYQGKSWRYYKTGANRILHSRNITFLRSHTAAEGAYDEMDWGESVVPPAEGENMTRSGSKSEQRDENARTGGAQRVSSEAKEETKPTSELKDIKSEVKSEQKASDSTSKSTTESKPTHHAAVHQPSSTRSKLAMPSGPRIDTANSIRKINALSSVNTSGVRTRRGNPNMPAISLDKERGGVKITVKDTAATSDELAGYCDDSGSDDSDAYIHGLNAYMQGIDAATHGTDFDDPGAHSNQVGTIGSARSLHSDISTLFSDVPSLVSDTDTSSVVSAPSIPSKLAYQLASPMTARIPSYTT
ncbi:integrase core domain protein, partial [Rhizoctonia solani 123E]